METVIERRRRSVRRRFIFKRVVKAKAPRLGCPVVKEYLQRLFVLVFVCLVSRRICYLGLVSARRDAIK